MRLPRTLAGRLFVWQLSTVLVVLAGFGLVLDRILEQDFVGDLTRSLASQARTVREALPADPADLQAAVADLGSSGGVRITVIRTDGVVLADSEHDPATMENHLRRPEVQQSLHGAVGASSRTSATLGTPFRYVALPPSGDVIVRLALPLTDVQRRLTAVRLAIGVGALAAAAVATIGVLLVSRGVSRPLRAGTQSLGRLGEGDLSARMQVPATPTELAVLATTVNRMADHLEEQIRSTEEERIKRDLILSSMEEAILLAGPDGSVRFVNSAFERLLGPAPVSLSGLSPVGLRDLARRAARERVGSTVEVETGPPRRSLRGAATPAGDDGSVLLVLRDVTEAKRVDAIRRDFVANASHELKTPAASIQAAAETIRGAVVDDPDVIPRFSEQLEREAARLSRIVSDLLDLSRLESGSELAELVPLDAVLGEEIARSRDAAVEAGIDLRAHAGAIPKMRGSARDLALLIRNLIDNAIRYTGPGGSVDVRLEGSNADVVLRVADTGLGIPSRDLPRIFERFYRVDRARSRDTGGTGLGLSIVKHVVENHGGSVHVTSELGRGSTFEVRLPAASDSA